MLSTQILTNTREYRLHLSVFFLLLLLFVCFLFLFLFFLHYGVIRYPVITFLLEGFYSFVRLYSYTLTITGQIVGTHSYPLWASAVKRSRDVKAMMTAAAISFSAFVSIYREYTMVLLKEILSQ